jgi:hypothetical protein
MDRHRGFARALLGCLCAIFCVSACLARTSVPKSYVDDKTRAIESGRKVLVVVPQTSIGAGYQTFNMGPMMGLVPVLISIEINKLRAGDAQRLAGPLYAALASYDFNGPFYASLLPPAKASSWLHGQDFEFTQAGDPHSLEAELNESNTRQMLVLCGTYYIDFHQQRLTVELKSTILIRKIPKGKHGSVRLDPDYIPYQQVYRYIAYLPQSEGAAPEANFARWAADDGKLARRALDRGILRVSTMFAANLDADKAAIGRWRHRGDRHTVEKFGLLGWVVERDGDRTQLVEARTGTLNDIETIAVD